MAHAGKHRVWTAKEIEALQHSGRRREKKDGTLGPLTADKHRDGGARGLLLNVYPTGKKSWSVRYTPVKGDQAGRETEAYIGDFPEFLPKDARDAADAIRHGARVGAGIVIEREEAKVQAEKLRLSTLAAVADDYLEFIEREPKPGKNGKVRRMLRPATKAKNKQAIEYHVKPRLGSTPVERIRRAEVIRHAEEIEHKSGPGAAYAFVAMTRRLLNHAINRGLIEANPALGIELTPLESRERVAEPKELAAVWKGLDRLRGYRRGWMSATAIQLCILTAKRRSEVAGITKAEVDFDNMLWTIPGDRAKNHTRDFVPLTEKTAALLREAFARSASETHAFVGKDYKTPIAPNVMTRMFARLRQGADILDLSLHDQRRTGATLMAELGVDERLVSRILAHTPADVPEVTGVYNRHPYIEEKRAALLIWEAKLAEIVAADYSEAVKPKTGRKPNTGKATNAEGSAVAA